MASITCCASCAPTQASARSSRPLTVPLAGIAAPRLAPRNAAFAGCRLQLRRQGSSSGNRDRSRRTATMAHITVLVADIGGTNCRFQVWQLDKHFRPSRMVVEQVRVGVGLAAAAAATLPPRASAAACPL